jgi:hypothetical protein
LQNDKETYVETVVGRTGVYIFPSEVLLSNPLIAIKTPQGETWPTGARLTYAQYVSRDSESFS